MSRRRRGGRVSTGSATLPPYIAYGASPRGPISVVAAARAMALFHGRDYVVAADLEALVRDAFRHRWSSRIRRSRKRSRRTGARHGARGVPAPQIDLGRTAPAAA